MVDIVEYIGQFVELEEKGNEFFGLCPFHEEDTPSFSVTPGTGKFFCFGCHKGGDVLTFIKMFNHVNYAEAKTILEEYCGCKNTCVKKQKRLSASKVARRFAVQNKRKDATYKELPDDVMERYEDAGKKLDVWRNEGINDRELQKYSVKYDSFTDRLVFPIRSPSGKIINISGRTLDPQYKEKKLPKYNYYGSLGRLDTMFGLYENRADIERKREIIIFEGAKSVMKAESYGFNNCVAALTSRINRYQLELLIQLGCRVVFAFDSDVELNKVDLIDTLKHYVHVDAVIDRQGLLDEKMSPVDRGADIWNFLYEGRIKIG